MRFNINDAVQVKLTDLGRRIYRKHWLDLGIKDPSGPTTTPDGWSQFQMWELMQIFGPHVGMAREIPFETEIRL